MGPSVQLLTKGLEIAEAC